MLIRRYLQELGVVCLAAIILCFAAFYNRCPLLFFDTGTYISSGFDLYMPLDRPIIYGLFLRHVSLNESLWFVVFAQGLILAGTVYVVLKSFVVGRTHLRWFFGYIIAITFLTGASINVSQLIPDVFTPVCILIIAILLISGSLSTSKYLLCFIVGSFCIATHNSNFLVCTAMLGIYVLFQFKTLLYNNKLAVLRPLKLILPILVTGLFLNNIVSTCIGYGFSPPNANHVFLMDRLLQTGLLEEYLNESCAKKEYKTCAYKDKLPSCFIWDANSPLNLMGGWTKNKEEYVEIIHDMLTTPKYLKKLTIKSIEAGFTMLFNFDTGDTPALSEGQPAYDQMKKHFPEQMRSYFISFQFSHAFNYDILNNLQKYFIACSLLVIILFFLRDNSTNSNIQIFAILIITAIVINAFVCGSLSGIYSRYESRVIWLLPLPAMIIVFNSKIWKNLLNKLTNEH